MIRLPRQTQPPLLGSKRAKELRARSRAFFARPLKERAQRRPFVDSRFLNSPELKKALWALSSGKCAYCESPLGAERSLEVDHFRPPFAAVNLDGAVSQDHYWWLAYEWENLLPACARCARAKGSRFPVGGSRGKPPTTGANLDKERPLLLDPRRDEAEGHLVFLDSGEVVSKNERGRVMIEVLALNRPQLLRDRAAELTQAVAEWAALAEPRTAPPKAIAELTSPSRPFAAMRRQFVATWADERGLPSADVTPAGEAAPPPVTSAEKRNLKSSFDARKKEQERYSVTKAAPDYFISSRLIERVVIENVRLFDHLELDFTPSSSTRAPWLMLLGENGTGKSTILQIVTLALVGDGYRRRLKVQPEHYLRRNERRGFVEVYLSGNPEPIRLDIARTSFKSNTHDPKVLLLGYGATRLLPRAGPGIKRLTTDVARVDNLFDPFTPLGDATGWLLELPAREFTSAARALKGILDLDPDVDLRRNRRAGRIDIEAYHQRVPLEHLSDGYQSVLALAVDVMSVMFRLWPSMEVAEGIVNIDELGAHLHPRWRMQIVTALRDFFPRVQFLASTHDPLCLRGLTDGEVAVLRRRDDGTVFTVTDLPPLEGLRVDQILTSEVFGLNSTVDPTLDALFARYYELKGKWTLSDGEEQELASLRAQLDDLEVLGQTARERLMLEAVDEFLARERQLADSGARRELRESTKEQLVELWQQSVPIKPPVIER